MYARSLSPPHLTQKGMVQTDMLGNPGRLAVVVMVLSAASTGCGPHLKLDGRVVSCDDHKPIPSAEVHYSYAGQVGASASEEHVKKVNKEGKFRLGAVNFAENTTVMVHVEAKGREPADETYYGTQDGEQEICLKKLGTRN